MRYLNERPVFSATDLADFVACEHLTQLNLRSARGEHIERTQQAIAQVLAGLGARHESRYLERLRAAGGTVIELSEEATRKGTRAELEAAAAETVAAMRAGHSVIYQACFFDGRWLGRADFLRRVETPSALGAHSYEVYDAKLARHVRPGALLQLSEYSLQLQRVQQAAPLRMWVVLGDGAEHPYLVDEFAAYHAAVRERLEQAVARGDEPYPERVDHCGVCEYASRCEQRRRHDDHLSLVARMRRDQVRKLTAAGISTVHALARPEALRVDVPRIRELALQALHDQARMQVAGPLADGTPRYELVREETPDFGLCGLPAPSAGDVFFDIEGDPWAAEGGLEYLFGAVELTPAGPAYRQWQGHSAAEERAAFAGFVDWVIARLDADPAMHVYHYASYERSALLRLMGRYGTHEAEIDRILRGGVLVDLYRVVRQSLRLSTNSYGLKAVEALYKQPRDARVVNAESSMIVYEQWLESNHDPAARDHTLLDAIVDYNREDCESTWRLREWLEVRRLEAAAEWGTDLARPLPPRSEEPQTPVEELRESELLRAQLCEGVTDDRARRDPGEQATWLLAQLLGYHRREGKVQWWHYYRRVEASQEELEDDPEVLGPLSAGHYERPEKQSKVFSYSFEPQEHRMREGKDAFTPCIVGGRRDAVSAGQVVRVDDAGGVIELKRGDAALQHGDPRFLMEGRPFGTSAQRAAVAAVGRWVLSHGIDAPGAHRAARDLLLRLPPRLRAGAAALERPGVGAGQRAVDAAEQLEAGCLAIQGPPGSGKTYVAAEIALRLIQQGRRVAVCAISHKAIGKLLEEIAAHAAAGGQAARIVQRADPDDACDAPGVVLAASNPHVAATLAEKAVDVVGGTSWLFSDDKLQDSFDTLIVDEAGQMSLADVIAISRCTRNLVLVGDPRQLAQVVQGTHPDGAGCSALEHLLGDDITIPADRGVFLDSTWRMCPPVCEFVSRAFYSGLLLPQAECALQGIDAGDTRGSLTGLRLALVEHEGDRTSSHAEADVVAGVVDTLLRSTLRTHEGNVRPLRLDDILVVAPYNAHVSCLKQHLPAEARVGTVDKFQGQEAAVSIFSMATSSTDDIPRNLEFLFSMNRLNVAVSRARCLSVLVCSPQLLRADCRTPRHMQLVNAVCRYREMSTPWDDGDAAELRQLLLPAAILPV